MRFLGYVNLFLSGMNFSLFMIHRNGMNLAAVLLGLVVAILLLNWGGR